MNIQKVKISAIKSNPNNPRLIKDDKFSTKQDRKASRKLFKTIHNQVFNKENKALVDILSIKPKKIITKPDLIV